MRTVKQKANKPQPEPYKNPQLETKFLQLRERFILQCNAVLGLFAEKGSVTFPQFQCMFTKVSPDSFESIFYRIKSVDNDYSITSIVDNAWLPKHDCFLKYDNNPEPFIAFEIKEMDKKPAKITQCGSASSSLSPVEQHEETAESHHDHNHAYLNSTFEQQVVPYTYEMFSEPLWLINEDSGSKKRRRFLEFMGRAVISQPKDQQVMREARKLADELWAPRLRFFPHIMYLLNQLSIKTPNGFHVDEFSKEMEKVLPPSWRILKSDLTFDSMLTGASDVMRLNLLMGCDKANIGKMVVNKAVGYLGFHEIRDHEVSMIYYFVSSTLQPKTVRSIHTFMCGDYPGWCNLHNEKSSMERIQYLCEQNKKMFEFKTEGLEKGYCAKQHAYKIAVPMSFSVLVVYRALGIA